ncbi:hypothetical protein [Maritalea sp.]|uniref:hypothetical protein n=1 Tax=Maritalea sp. TaxID=2003361 RepID=UPI003EFA56A2
MNWHTKLLIALTFLFASTGAYAANFEVKSASTIEHGWSGKTDCEGEASDGCASAYFCSNEIWIGQTAFSRIQDLRYAGEQLVIVKDGKPICAVN